MNLLGALEQLGLIVLACSPIFFLMWGLEKLSDWLYRTAFDPERVKAWIEAKQAAAIAHEQVRWRNREKEIEDRDK
jgi:hypothetical protein